MSKSITIIKKDGEVQNKEFIYKRLESIFSLIKNGEHDLTVKKTVKARSINQNNMMWMWYACLAKETGCESEDFHKYYCSKFLVEYIKIEGVERKVVGGTSKLDTVAMTEFLNKVQADAASEFGIALPIPDDLSWKSFEEEFSRYPGR